MALLSGSVEADVPIKFANKEWSEFIWRSMYGSYTTGFDDVLAASDVERDADNGKVTFETRGDRLVKVSVELEFTPNATGDATAELAQAQKRLDRDLEKYRDLVMRRCERRNTAARARRSAAHSPSATRAAL